MTAKTENTNGSFKRQVIMAGLGGSGVLLAGELLLHAAAPQYEHIAYFPSYGVSMRGGHVECTVILSQERIASPLLNQADVVVIFNNGKLREFEGRVRSGGLLILESTGLQEEPDRADIQVIKVPAIEMATAVGDIRSANQVLLGAYIKATGALAPEVVEKELERQMIEKNKEKFLPTNQEAFRRGLEMI